MSIPPDFPLEVPEVYCDKNWQRSGPGSPLSWLQGPHQWALLRDVQLTAGHRLEYECVFCQDVKNVTLP